MSKLNWPNALTTVRLLLTIPLVYFIVTNQILNAFIVMVLALVTELDGTVARKTNTASKFGKLYDPVVDGTFLGAGWLTLLYLGKMPLIPLAIFVVIYLISLTIVARIYKIKKDVTVTPLMRFSGFIASLMLVFAVFEFSFLIYYMFVTIIFALIVLYQVYQQYRKILNTK